MNLQSPLKLAVLATALLAPLAQAELIEADGFVTGDNLAVFDTVNGYTWLDLTVTDGLSINQVEAELDSTYAGWRLPTVAEVGALMESAFPTLDDVPTGSYDGMARTELQQFLDVFGTTHGSDFSYGTSRSGDGIETSGVWVSSSRTLYRIDTAGDGDTVSAARGVFLIKEGAPVLPPAADVSIPAGIGALGLGLLGLAGLRRRRTDDVAH